MLSISGVAANQRLDLAVDLTERLPATLAGLENGEIDLLRAHASGTVLDYGRITYKPPARCADFVRARDKTGNSHGCTRSSHRCQLDHRRQYPGRRTSADNLDALCTHHHQPKHRSDWSVERLANGHYNGSARPASSTPVAQNPFIDRR